MNPYFKKFIKDAALGAGVLSVAGTICGAASGVIGLRQMCFVDMEQKELCEKQLYPLIIPVAQSAAASAGAATGAIVGAVIGSVLYPTYQSFLGWCYHSAPEEGRIVNVNDFGNDRGQRLNV